MPEIIIYMSAPELIGLEAYSHQLEARVRLAVEKMRAMDGDGWLLTIKTPGKDTISRVMKERRDDGVEESV